MIDFKYWLNLFILRILNVTLLYKNLDTFYGGRDKQNLRFDLNSGHYLDVGTRHTPVLP
jgi:hypothetical protein